ncbi:MAG TPA: transketolase C-terminal domain-containing protein, partial [Blastocatellia bacterium]|nr:transketolase C-terminal domain-containing protein [Blastocatellia bacterium]
IAHEAFDYLDAPVMRVASLDVPVPYSPPLEMAMLPSVDKIEAAAKELLAY